MLLFNSMRFRAFSLTALMAATTGCAVADHPTAPLAAPKVSVTTWDEVFSKPAVLTHEAVVSATWHVPLSGLLNLEHPRAKAAGLTDREADIALPVHVLRHPTLGLYIIDTGMTEQTHVRGLVPMFVDDINIVQPVGKIIADAGGELAGVLLTHFHLDHVLGLPEIERDVPIMIGPGELDVTSVENAFSRSSYDAFLADRPPLRTFAFDDAMSIGDIPRAIDVLGDGSLWALHMPGHTPGSTAYLAHTVSGPKLFTGDVSHTQWGFDNGVEPGEYTADHTANAESLALLRKLVERHPQIEVFVGHELGQVTTGVGRNTEPN